MYKRCPRIELDILQTASSLHSDSNANRIEEENVTNHNETMQEQKFTTEKL